MLGNFKIYFFKGMKAAIKMKKILKTRPDGRCWNDKSMAISHYRRSDYQRNLR